MEVPSRDRFERKVAFLRTFRIKVLLTVGTYRRQSYERRIYGLAGSLSHGQRQEDLEKDNELVVTKSDSVTEQSQRQLTNRQRKIQGERKWVLHTAIFSEL